MKLLIKWKFCIYIVAVVVLPLFFNNNVKAGKTLPGLTPELTQKYGKDINELIEFYQCDPYKSEKYKILQRKALNAIKNSITSSRLLNFKQTPPNVMEAILKSKNFPAECIKPVLDLYNTPILGEKVLVVFYKTSPFARKTLQDSYNKSLLEALRAINGAQRVLEEQYRELLSIASGCEINLNSDL